MALSRKRSRTLKVGSETYRWSVSEDSGYSVLVVQSATGSGQKREVIQSWADPAPAGSAARPGPSPITPGQVADAIRMALARGWEPDRRDPQPFRHSLESWDSIE